MESAIQTENLSKRFRRVHALNGLDLDVAAGAIYALVGPNGAGKTTAIKILMNIIRPTSGQARVLGRESKRLAGRAFTEIGYVSENQELPGWMRVDRFLEYLRPFYPSWDRELENQLAQQFDLPSDRKLKHLSRGMQMKAALVSALAYHPKLIVLDEPFGGLDPLVRDQLIEGLLARAAETTIFISSHDLGEVETFASHVGYLDQGRLVFSENLAALSARFRQVELTFDAPPSLPEAWPASWIQPAVSAATIRFIETSFEAERIGAEVRRVFGEVRQAVFTPMSLRSIFLAVAKNQRAGS
jgi:ABC-2 type transport system ATP-binding protein